MSNVDVGAVGGAGLLGSVDGTRHGGALLRGVGWGCLIAILFLLLVGVEMVLVGFVLG